MNESDGEILRRVLLKRVNKTDVLENEVATAFQEGTHTN